MAIKVASLTFAPLPGGKPVLEGMGALKQHFLVLGQFFTNKWGVKQKRQRENKREPLGGAATNMGDT
jgi:hypothetical protein